MIADRIYLIGAGFCIDIIAFCLQGFIRNDEPHYSPDPSEIEIYKNVVAAASEIVYSLGDRLPKQWFIPSDSEIIEIWALFEPTASIRGPPGI